MNKIKKILNPKTYPFITLFIIMLGLNLFKSVVFADDNWFREVLLSGSGPLPDISTMKDYVIFRYNNWTSRVVIEFFLVIFTGKFPLLWRIFDSLMYVIIAYSIKRIFLNSKENKISWITVILVSMIPILLVREAGWIATSVNYIWPIACGLIALIPIRKCLDNQKINVIEYLIYLPFTLYAINSELVCACILVTYIIFSIYLIIKKKMKPIIILILLLSIISIIFILTCPGNSVRTNQEKATYFSDYNNLSLIEKILIGIISTMNYYLFNFNIIYFIFTLIMMIIVFRKYDNILFKVISCFPFIMRYYI